MCRSFSLTFFTFLVLVLFGRTLYAQSSIDPQHRELTSILISADPQEASLLGYTKPITVMTESEIAQRGETGIGDILQTQPGVSSSSFGPAASRPIIRGFSGERVRVLRNGISSFDLSSSSEDHQVAINPLNADSIEVLRGPETLVFGGSAIGGAVNVTESSIAEQSVGSDLKGDLLLRGESADNELTGAGKLEGQIGHFNWHLSGMSQDTEDIRIPRSAESSRLKQQEALIDNDHQTERTDRRLDNSFSRLGTFTVGGSYVWEQGFFGTSFSQYNSRYGIPGHSHGEDLSHGDDSEDELPGEAPIFDPHDRETLEHEDTLPLISMDQWRVDSRGAVYDVSDEIDQIRFRIGGSQYEHSELEGATRGTQFNNNALEGRVDLFHNSLAGFKGLVGSQLEVGEFTAQGSEAFVPGFERLAAGVFAYEEFALMRALNLLIGGRYEFAALTTPHLIDREFHPLSLSTGVAWQIGSKQHYVAGLNFSYTERAPSAFELYADGIHAARQIYERGNTTLSEERAVGIDLSLKKNVGVVTSGLNIFSQQYLDYINLSPTDERFNGFQVFDYQSVRARFYGFELENTLHVHDLLDLGVHHIDLTAQFDYVRARNLSDSSDLPRIPPFRSILRASYDWKERVIVMAEGVLAAAQRDIATTELPTDSYQVLNISLQYKMPLNSKRSVSFFIKGLNLTNQEVRYHTSFIKDIAPQPGRSGLVGMQISF